MSDWASSAHLPTTAICAACPHQLGQHDGEQQQCDFCQCDRFVVRAEDAESIEEMEPARNLPLERAHGQPRGASVGTMARNLENGRKAQAEALAILEQRKQQSRKKAG